MISMWTYIMRIVAHTIIREPLCLGDKPIVGALEDPYEGYGPNYMGALGFLKMKSLT